VLAAPVKNALFSNFGNFDDAPADGLRGRVDVFQASFGFVH
jgi:hypothetical protein